MKTCATLFVVAALSITGSQADAQVLSGGNDSTTQLPAVQKVREAARNAFYASYDAYVAARAESGRSSGFLASANLQYEALLKTYYAWSMAEANNTFTSKQLDSIELLVREAERDAYYAAWNAFFGAYEVGNPQHPAFARAVDSWNKIELLVDEVAAVIPLE